MSYFAAFRLPAAPARALERAVAGVARTDGFRLESAERYHVTLCHYGEIEPRDLPRLTLALDAVARMSSPLRVRVVGAGWFPAGRVIWAGIDGDLAGLRGLRERVMDATAPLGRDSRVETGFTRGVFAPHVTVARYTASAVEPSRLVTMLRRAVDGESFEVGSFGLYESVGGRHLRLAEFSLREQLS
ncbi:MAG: RNA 2',3'-cyclic phosphodiesterase [Ilumatobacteraceae bacterium]